MVKNRRTIAVTLVGILIVMVALFRVGGDEREFFVGLCVYSSDGFSVLTNGTHSVGVPATLELGRTYLVEGRFYESSSGTRVDPSRVVETVPDFPLTGISGAYWFSGDRYYLLTPAKVRLAHPLEASKGEMVRARGIFYRGRFYPVNYSRLGPLLSPADGMPWSVRGVVLYSGRKTILWNGSAEIALYLPYGLHLKPGTEIRAIGIFRRYSMPSLLVDSSGDVAVVGNAPRVPVEEAGTGEVAVGSCMVVDVGKSSLRLNCTKLRLTGFRARDGDTVHFEALVRKSSMLCLNCKIQKSREELPNGICGFSPGRFARVHGRVEWVKVYGNGFGLANVTDGKCWVLLKLRKSLGVSLTANGTVTAYGTFTTYRGMPALEIRSGDDVCSGNC